MKKINRIKIISIIDSLELQKGGPSHSLIDIAIANKQNGIQHDILYLGKKIKKFNNYQKKIFYNKNILYYNFPILIRPLFLFLYRYFYKLGFLDGLNGFIFSLVQTFYYRSLVDIMIIKFYLKKFFLKNEKY